MMMMRLLLLVVVFIILFPTRSLAFLPSSSLSSSSSSSLPSSLQQLRHSSSCMTTQQHQQHYYHQLHLLPTSTNQQLIHTTSKDQQHHDDPTIPVTTTTTTTTTTAHHYYKQQKATIGDEDFMVINNTQDENDNDDDNDNEKTYQIAFRNTILSIVVSILFGAGLWVGIGSDVGKEFFAGYIVEKSLSVDNLFVFLLLFDYFDIPSTGQYRNRILTWGIYGSIIMRSIMITLGAAALQHFKPVLLLFASILIYSSIQVLIDVEDEIDDNINIINTTTNEEEEEGEGRSHRHLDLESNPVIKLSRYICEVNEYCDIDEFDNAANNGNGGNGGSNNPNPIVLFTRSLFPSTSELDGDKFFITTDDGIQKATPLFVCMVAIELSDVVFAVDSIPAVFGVTENPLVVFSSNMFAILGLRSLFPVLSKAVNELKYLESAVAVILAFIGGKMILEYFDYTPISTETALAVIISLLAIGVIASMLDNNNNNKNEIEVL